MKNYSQFYKFGKNLPGGGNPLRDYSYERDYEAVPDEQNNPYMAGVDRQRDNIVPNPGYLNSTDYSRRMTPQ